VQKENSEIDRLENFPVTFFAVVMGMLGLTLAAHATETALGASSTGPSSCWRSRS
jgi:tellurite resistance protein